MSQVSEIAGPPAAGRPDTPRALSASTGTRAGSYGWPELALVLALHVLCFVALNGNFDHDFDAQQYGRIAHEISRGEYVLSTHPFSQRFVVTGPAALCFLLLGETWLAATLWPLLCSLATIVLVHLTLRRTLSRRAALVGAFLLAVDLVQVRFSSRLLPDVVVSAFMLGGAVLVERGRARLGGGELRTGVAAALTLFVGCLAKETVVWAGPFFAALCLLDLLRGRNRRLWMGFFAGSAACATAFLAGYALLTGDPLYRLNGIENIHNTRAGFFEGGLEQFARRLTVDPLVFLLERPGFGLPLLLALPAIVMAARAPRRETASARYWSGYALVVMGSFWFGTTSLRVYTPLYLADRFLMPFLAPLAILGAITVARVLDASGRERRSPLEALPLVLGALGAAALLAGDGIKRAVLYAGLGIAGAVAARLGSSAPGSSGHRAATVLVLAVMTVPLVDYARRGDPHETPLLIGAERAMLAELAREERAHDRPTAIFTDPHSTFVLPFYLPGGPPEGLRFVSWDDPEAALRPGERALLYVHSPRLIAVNLNWGQRLPSFGRQQSAHWRVLHELDLDERSWVRVYELDPEELATLLE